MNCVQLHLYLLTSILVVQFIVTIVEPMEHTFSDITHFGKLRFKYYFLSNSIVL